MIKLLKRTTDNKFLQSIENESWVDDPKEAFKMTYRECEIAKSSLNGIFLPEQLKEIVNLRESKPISEEERQELINLLKR